MSYRLPLMYDDYDCTRCGACCVSSYPDTTYVHISPDEVEAFTPTERTQLLVSDDRYTGLYKTALRASMDSRGHCRCVALNGPVGSQVSCRVYDRRPGVCRKFEAGSAECDYARKQILGISDK